MKQFGYLILFLSMSLSGFGQEAATSGIEMADAMRSSGKIYVVVAVLVIIMAGLLIYLINIDRKVGKIEKELNSKIEE